MGAASVALRATGAASRWREQRPYAADPYHRFHKPVV